MACLKQRFGLKASLLGFLKRPAHCQPIVSDLETVVAHAVSWVRFPHIPAKLFNKINKLKPFALPCLVYQPFIRADQSFAPLQQFPQVFASRMEISSERRLRAVKRQ